MKKTYKTAIILVSLLLNACSIKPAETLPPVSGADTGSASQEAAASPVPSAASSTASSAVSPAAPPAQTSLPETSSSRTGGPGTPVPGNQTNTGKPQPVRTEAPSPRPLQLSKAMGWEYDWSDKLNMIYVEVSHELVRLTGESADSFPGLASVLDGRNEKLHYDTKAQHERLKELADEYMGETDGEAQGYFSADELFVQRADSTALSMARCISSYEGGVHGYYCVVGENYDTATGDMLELGDVVRDREKFAGYVLEGLMNNYPDAGYLEQEDILKDYISGDREFEWTVGYEGVTVYFNPYDIASYADGILNIHIPFRGNDGLFDERYTRVPEAYAVEMSPVSDTFIDINGDGSCECLWPCVMESGDEGGYNDYSLFIGEDEYPEETQSFEAESYVIHDGKNVSLYVFARSENDYVVCHTFDLSTGSPVPSGSIDAVMSSDGSFDIGDCTYYCSLVLTDPGNMSMDTRMNTLGTYTGRMLYHAGGSGAPESEDGFFTVPSVFMGLTALQDVEGTEVDADGTEKGTAVIAEGTKCGILRTDDSTMADLKCEDGRIIRLQVVTGDWPQKVNGKDISELFDGMVFAG